MSVISPPHVLEFSMLVSFESAILTYPNLVDGVCSNASFSGSEGWGRESGRNGRGVSTHCMSPSEAPHVVFLCSRSWTHSPTFFHCSLTVSQSVSGQQKAPTPPNKNEKENLVYLSIPRELIDLWPTILDSPCHRRSKGDRVPTPTILNTLDENT